MKRIPAFVLTLCTLLTLCACAAKTQPSEAPAETTLTYGSPFDMMKSFGITYNYAGENIAMGYSSPEAVMTAWMNSAGHRANILSANFTTLGVGYGADGGYWTQWFIG